jgi:Spy/CpxP family protein refolding chaperone
MKEKLRYALVLLLLVPVLAHAQQRMTEEEKNEMRKRYEQFQAELNLTGEQRTKVEKINEEFFAGLSSIRNSNDRKLQKYNRYKDIQRKKDNQMKSVLDAEQFKKYEVFQKQLRDDIRENRRNN